jgi:hypothetical protein
VALGAAEPEPDLKTRSRNPRKFFVVNGEWKPPNSNGGKKKNKRQRRQPRIKLTDRAGTWDVGSWLTSRAQLSTTRASPRRRPWAQPAILRPPTRAGTRISSSTALIFKRRRIIRWKMERLAAVRSSARSAFCGSQGSRNPRKVFVLISGEGKPPNSNGGKKQQGDAASSSQIELLGRGMSAHGLQASRSVDERKKIRKRILGK